MNAALVARTGWRLSRRSLWSAGRPRRGLLSLAIALVVFMGLGGAALALFRALADAHAAGEGSARVLGWAFSLAAAMLVLGDLRVAISALVSAPDLERLRAAPLSPRELVALKLVETLPRTLPPVLCVALPVALAYARVQGGVHAASLAVALLALWAVPLGLGVASALPLLRIAPASRMRESLAVLATVAFVAGWLVNAFWMPRLAGGAAASNAGLGVLPAPPGWSPATWAASAIAEPWPKGLAAVGVCALAAVASLGLAAAAATRLLAGLHARGGGVLGRSVRARARRAPTLALAFLHRDAALVARDWPVSLDALANMALWSLLPLAVVPLAPLPHLELARDMLVALSVSLGHDVAARALPLERTSLAWARLSPVGGARWVRLRALGVAAVSGAAVAAATVLVSLAFRLDARAVFDVLAFGLAAAITATSTGLALGARLGDPAWTDPRAMLGAGGRTASAAVLLAGAAGWLALSHALSPTAPLRAATSLALLVAAALAASALLALAARAVERREFAAG